MGIDIALYTLDLFARDEPVDFDSVRLAAKLVSHYVNFLELYSGPEAVSISRGNLRLVADQHPQPGDFLAVVTLGGRDYMVSVYNHVLGGIALRLAERELAQKLSLRTVEGQIDAPDFQPVSMVISAAAAQPRHKTN